MSEFNISPTFSVYKLVARVENVSSIINHRRAMTVISHEIENATLLDNAHTTIFAGFQRLSRFLPQVARYEQLAQRARAIYVFGVPDATMPSIPNVTYVPLKPSDQLTKEWFLVSLGRDYASALATEELTHIDDPDEMRVFKGIWTFDVDMVMILHDWLTQVVGLRSDLDNAAMTHKHHQLSYLGEVILRMRARVERLARQGKEDTLREEIDQLLRSQLQNAFHQLKTTHVPPVG